MPIDKKVKIKSTLKKRTKNGSKKSRQKVPKKRRSCPFLGTKPMGVMPIGGGVFCWPVFKNHLPLRLRKHSFFQRTKQEERTGQTRHHSLTSSRWLVHEKSLASGGHARWRGAAYSTGNSTSLFFPATSRSNCHRLLLDSKFDNDRFR